MITLYFTKLNARVLWVITKVGAFFFYGGHEQSQLSEVRVHGQRYWKSVIFLVATYISLKLISFYPFSFLFVTAYHGRRTASITLFHTVLSFAYILHLLTPKFLKTSSTHTFTSYFSIFLLILDALHTFLLGHFTSSIYFSLIHIFYYNVLSHELVQIMNICENSSLNNCLPKIWQTSLSFLIIVLKFLLYININGLHCRKTLPKD